MINIFSFIFSCISQVFSIMNEFLIVNGVSLLLFYTGFLILPILIMCIKFGIEVSTSSERAYINYSNHENAKNKYEQRRYHGAHEFRGNHERGGKHIKRGKHEKI